MIKTIFITLLLSFTIISPAMADFYKQSPMTEQELLKFIDDLPSYLSWARSEKEVAHPSLSDKGRPTFIYSQKAADKVKELGWQDKRFFYVMGKAAAALSLESSNISIRDKAVDMPVVKPSEFDIVRKHAEKLVNAGSSK